MTQNLKTRPVGTGGMLTVETLGNAILILRNLLKIRCSRCQQSPRSPNPQYTGSTRNYFLMVPGESGRFTGQRGFISVLPVTQTNSPSSTSDSAMMHSLTNVHCFRLVTAFPLAEATLSDAVFQDGRLRKNDFYPQPARRDVFGTNRATVDPDDSVGDRQTETRAA
jgi:hypothetical protein